MDNYTSPTDYDVLIEDSYYDNDITEHDDNYEDKVFAAKFLPPIYSLVFILGLVGNAFLILILVKYKGLRMVINIYFLNIAISSFIFLVPFPFWIHSAIIHSWDFGDTACKMISGFYSVGYYGYTCFLILLLIHRYLAIVYMGRFHLATKVATYGIIISAWGIVILVALTEFLFSQVQMEGSNYICRFVWPLYPPENKKFWKYFMTLKMNILGFLVPLFVIIFCYGRIKKTSRNQEKKYELCRLIFIMTLVFMGLWTPYNLVLFLTTFQEHLNLGDHKSSHALNKAVQVTQIIANTYCFINPVVYGILDKTFRKELYRLFQLHRSTEGHFSEELKQQSSTAKEQLYHTTKL